MPDELGYRYYPFDHSPALGYARLDVNLTAEPTDRFFDAMQIRLMAAEGDSSVKQISINHPWHGQSLLHVCAGYFSLHAHDNDLVCGFSLGGDLEISKGDDLTVCRFTSTAPILDLPDDSQASERILAGALKALFAKRQAAWGLDDPGFNKRLIQVDPFQLLVAGLATLEEKTDQPSETDGRFKDQAVVRAVNWAINILKETDRWPPSPPTLEELL